MKKSVLRQVFVPGVCYLFSLPSVIRLGSVCGLFGNKSLFCTGIKEALPLMVGYTEL